MLLFFDIDGTIFDDQRRLPASVLPAMEAAHARGHQLIINTGRTLCNIDRRLDGFPLDGWIFGCGTRILYHGETLQSMEHPLPESLKLRQLFLDMGIPAVWECDTAMYFDPLSPAHRYMDGFVRFAREHGLYREIREGDPDFLAVKMFCFCGEEKIEEMKRRTAAIGMPYTAIDRMPEGWELVPLGYSKGKGIGILRGKLGVPKADCFAFGDSNNDRTMFEHAGVSIVMGNAGDDVKALGTYVAARPEDDGIAEALRHFHLI